jgi:hypothetical protein
VSRTKRFKHKIGFTSICDEPSVEFMGAFRETFNYLGMHFGGSVHVNCSDGYLPAVHDSGAVAFAAPAQVPFRALGAGGQQ